MDFLNDVPQHLGSHPKLILLLTDNPTACLRLANSLRADGDTVRIIDARWFDEMSIEPCNRIVFVGAYKREFIVQCYRSDYYRNAYPGIGACEFVDMDVAGDVMGQTAPEPKLQASETLSAAFVLPGDGTPPAAIADPVPPEPAPKAKKTADLA